VWLLDCSRFAGLGAAGTADDDPPRGDECEDGEAEQQKVGVELSVECGAGEGSADPPPPRAPSEIPMRKPRGEARSALVVSTPPS